MVLSDIERIVVHGYYVEYDNNNFIDHDIALIKVNLVLQSLNICQG